MRGGKISVQIGCLFDLCKHLKEKLRQAGLTCPTTGQEGGTSYMGAEYALE